MPKMKIIIVGDVAVYEWHRCYYIFIIETIIIRGPPIQLKHTHQDKKKKTEIFIQRQFI